MATKGDSVYKHKSNSREYLAALTSYPSYCKLLFGKGKAYDNLINWIMSFVNDSKEETVMPDLKEIAKQSGVPYSNIAKYLQEIYLDIFDLNFDEPRKFVSDNERVCCLYINYLGCFTYFNIGLNTIPKQNEQFIFSFVNPKVGSSRFWVKNVRHEIFNGKQIVYIELTYERPNLYLQLLKEKAFLNNELHWKEYYGELDLDTKERLISKNKSL